MPRTVKLLTPEDWERAALKAIAAGGLEAVAVEPLARKLGVTKGSFYAHFRNRDELLSAALQRWERAQVNGFLADPDPADEPGQRLPQLLTKAIREARSGTVLARLLLESKDRRVRAAIKRVTEIRLTRLEAAFAEAGDPPPLAAHRAIISYSIYIGLLALAGELPRAIVDERTFSDELGRALGLDLRAA